MRGLLDRSDGRFTHGDSRVGLDVRIGLGERHVSLHPAVWMRSLAKLGRTKISMHHHDPSTFVDIAISRGREALWRGELNKALMFANQALQVAYDAGDPVRTATSLDLVGDVATRRGEVLEARRAYASALDLYRQLGSEVGQANIELSLGHLAERLGDLVAAHRHFEAALSGYRRAGRERGQAQALTGLGKIAVQQGQREHAGDCHAAALLIFERLDDRSGVANIRYQMAILAARENAGGGIEDLEAALRLFSEVGDKLGMANAHLALARARAARKDRFGADEHLENSLRLYKDLDSAFGLADSFSLAGDFALQDNEFTRALTFFTAAEASAARAGTLGMAAWLRFRSGTVMVAQGSINEGFALVERARRELAGMDPNQWSSEIAEIDDWIANTQRRLGLEATIGEVCICGSGKLFRQCHGADDDLQET